MTTQPNKADLRSTLQGNEPSLAGRDLQLSVVEQAFDYRGDVTIHTADGRVIEGYVFDRNISTPDPYLRLIPKDQSSRLTVQLAQITRLVFTGKDTAAGKSWETWVKKHQEKKDRGETASMEPEPLD